MMAASNTHSWQLPALHGTGWVTSVASVQANSTALIGNTGTAAALNERVYGQRTNPESLRV